MTEFAIYPLPVAAGTLAISPVPGRSGDYLADLSRLLDWRPDVVVTMTAQSELDGTGAARFGADLARAGVGWHHLPVVDYGVPDDAATVAWAGVHADVLAVLADGGRVVVHCFGGCGRSGMAVLRLMVAAGEDGDTALARLRSVRPCAVETDAQRLWAMRGNLG